MGDMALGGGPDWTWLFYAAAFACMIGGQLWLARISGGDEEPDRTFWRYQRRRAGGSWMVSWIPGAPELPTQGWLLTRAAMAIGVGSIVVAAVGPLVLRRWERVLEGVFVLAAPVWAIAVIAAAIGSIWLVRIARRNPEAGPAAWRYLRRR